MYILYAVKIYLQGCVSVIIDKIGIPMITYLVSGKHCVVSLSYCNKYYTYLYSPYTCSDNTSRVTN
jgi:hypothetical protein